MTLRPDPARPGLWVNDAWQPGTPGTFAVVAGVSAYRHLDASARTFQMGQLFVSALTAYNFFEWLDTQYRRNGCPLAKCWLLLAPAPAELACRPQMAQCAAEPTFAGCESAIQEWFAAMAALPAGAAANSRSVFFFSGHGLEVIEDRQCNCCCHPIT